MGVFSPFVDNIEFHIETSLGQTKDATEQLSRANQNQKKSWQKIKLYLIIFLLCILAIIVLLLSI